MNKKTTIAFLFMALLTCFILLGGTTVKADEEDDEVSILINTYSSIPTLVV